MLLVERSRRHWDAAVRHTSPLHQSANLEPSENIWSGTRPQWSKLATSHYHGSLLASEVTKSIKPPTSHSASWFMRL